MNASPKWDIAQQGDLTFQRNLFWSKVEKSAGCWLWSGSTYPNGYGQFGVKRAGKATKALAHRISYAFANGAIPGGMQIDHTCHNRACVNPEHLRLATSKQNRENLNGPIGNNTSGIRGVFRSSTGKPWRAAVGHHGRQVHVGTYHTREEAEAAVIARRIELHTFNDSDRNVTL